MAKKNNGLSPEAKDAVADRARARSAWLPDDQLEALCAERGLHVIRPGGRVAGMDEHAGWRLSFDEYDVDLMNLEFAVVMVGSGVLIARQTRDKVSLLRPDAFSTLLLNRIVEVTDSKGEPKWISWAKAWLGDADRRQYEGLEFFPDAKNAPGTPGYLNLWRGFSVRPRKGGSYAIFRDHMLTNVCNGDETLFEWLFAWFAQMFQQPRDKPGTAVVLRGGMGVGKSKVGEVFGSLLGEHFFLVDDPRYVTGNFNAHMGACLLLQADEAVWAGNKDAEGRLKSMITGRTHMIEGKGVDAVQLPNYIHLLMTSNEDWVIPAGKDERRFAVFDVSPHCAGNHDYFRQMEAELDSGGREALLYDLLRLDLSEMNLRMIPKTDALLSQKIRSLDHVETWLLDRLKDGSPTEKHEGWPDIVAKRALYKDYTDAADRIGVRRKASETHFHMKLQDLMKDWEDTRRRITHNDNVAGVLTRIYVLSSLTQSRESMEAAMGQPIAWGD